MRGNELLDKMELIDPEFIEAADRMHVKRKVLWIRWVAMAACFCLIVSMIHLLPGLRNAPGPVPTMPGVEHTSQGEDEPVTITLEPGVWYDEYVGQGALLFNEAVSNMSADRSYIPGYFTEALSDKEIAAVVSENVMEHMVLAGSAGFDGTGKLLNVVLEINGSFLENSANLVYHLGAPDSGYVLLEEPVACTYNGIGFTVYQWSADGEEYILDAYAQIGYWTMRVSYTAPANDLDNAKLDFETLIRCLTDVEHGKPDFSLIAAEKIPEFFDDKLTLNEARNDSVFGEYMLQAIPEGFLGESIRRYKDQTQDYLSGLWTKGLEELSWVISEYKETDSGRLTNIADTENYDLSLYPIPRAESVPEELREIVNCPIFSAEELTLDAVYKRAYKADDAGDVDGWRMMFAVKYGDVVIELRTKGVEPEWVFQQLMNILDN